nr:TonB-dependent receptor [Bacteroidota bacterium]
WFGITRLTYGKNKFNADFNAQYQSGVDFSQLPPSEQAKPHLYAVNSEGKPYSPQWFTLNFKMMYQLTDNFSFNAGVENILDVRYRPFTSGLSAPGRNFIFSVRASF